MLFPPLISSAAGSFFSHNLPFSARNHVQTQTETVPGKKKDNLQLPQTPGKKTLYTFLDTKTRQIFYDRLPSPSTRRRSRHPVYLTFKVSRQDGEVLHIYRSRARSMCRQLASIHGTGFGARECAACFDVSFHEHMVGCKPRGVAPSAPCNTSGGAG